MYENRILIFFFVKFLKLKVVFNLTNEYNLLYFNLY